MKQITTLILLNFLIIGYSNNLRVSANDKTDSLKITKVVMDFYDWYLNSIKGLNDNEFKPKFIADENGMTTLDYSDYVKYLIKYHFSDSLILLEKQSYNVCITNLKKIKFSEFGKTIFIELDEYENSNCDFGNYFRWIGGQEPKDGIRIKKVQFIENDTAQVEIEYFDFDSKENKYFYRGNNYVRMIKLNQIWYIDKIDSWRK